MVMKKKVEWEVEQRAVSVKKAEREGMIY